MICSTLTQEVIRKNSKLNELLDTEVWMIDGNNVKNYISNFDIEDHMKSEIESMDKNIVKTQELNKRLVPINLKK